MKICKELPHKETEFGYQKILEKNNEAQSVNRSDSTYNSNNKLSRKTEFEYQKNLLMR